MGLLPDSGNSGHNAIHARIPKEKEEVQHDLAQNYWTLRRALKTYQFWCFFLGQMFFPIGLAAVQVHQVAHVVDIGYSKLAAASVFGIMGIFSTMGRILFGFISDKIGREWTITLSFVASGGGMAVLLFMHDTSHPWMLYLFTFLFGLGLGARMPVLTVMAAEMFPGKEFVSIYGFLSMSRAAGAVGPWLGGYLYDRLGSYRLTFLVSLISVTIGCAFIWIAGLGKKALYEKARQSAAS